jgi:hypothetical protein
VAHQLGVARQERQPLPRELARWRPERAAQRRPTGQAPRLSHAQLAAIDQALRQGAGGHGFDTDHWTWPGSPS